MVIELKEANLGAGGGGASAAGSPGIIFGAGAGDSGGTQFRVTAQPASEETWFTVKTVGFNLDTKAVLEEGEFAGHGAVFGNLDRQGDIIAPGAFRDTLPEFRQSGVVAWQHDWRTPIGRPVECHEDDFGLYIKGKISKTTCGNDALTLLRDGVVRKMSIGYRTIESEWHETMESLREWATANRVNLQVGDISGIYGGIRVLTKIELYEISLVTVPANPLADVDAVKQVERILRAGMTLDDHSKAVLAAVTGFKGRIEDLVALRQKEGRVISTANVSKIQAVMDAVDALHSQCEPVRTLLAGLQKPADTEAGGADLRARLLRMKLDYLKPSGQSAA